MFAFNFRLLQSPCGRVVKASDLRSLGENLAGSNPAAGKRFAPRLHFCSGLVVFCARSCPSFYWNYDVMIFCYFVTEPSS